LQRGVTFMKPKIQFARGSHIYETKDGTTHQKQRLFETIYIVLFVRAWHQLMIKGK